MLANAMLCSLIVLTPVVAAGSHARSGKTASGIVDRSPVIEELLDELSDSMRKRGGRHGRDPQAASELLRDLHGRFPDCGPRDRKAIVKQVLRGIERFDAEHPDGQEFMLAAASALASMGPESVEPLVGSVRNDDLEDNAELYRRLILSLGRTRDPEAVSQLLKLLHHRDPAVEAAAAEALGEFEQLEESRRKRVFYALLGRLLDAKLRLEQDEFDVTDRGHYETIVGAMTTSLQRLSRHDERDPEQWVRFWNKNKNEPWGSETL